MTDLDPWARGRDRTRWDRGAATARRPESLDDLAAHHGGRL